MEKMIRQVEQMNSIAISIPASVLITSVKGMKQFKANAYHLIKDVMVISIVFLGMMRKHAVLSNVKLHSSNVPVGNVSSLSLFVTWVSTYYYHLKLLTIYVTNKNLCPN
jgi:hypothetical protein